MYEGDAYHQSPGSAIPSPLLGAQSFEGLGHDVEEPTRFAHFPVEFDVSWCYRRWNGPPIAPVPPCRSESEAWALRGREAPRDRSNPEWRLVAPQSGRRRGVQDVTATGFPLAVGDALDLYLGLEGR